VPLDQHASGKKQVLNRVSKVMIYLTCKHFWSYHSFCIEREEEEEKEKVISFRHLTLVRITAI